jgi:hypothetical protein
MHKSKYLVVSLCVLFLGCEAEFSFSDYPPRPNRPSRYSSSSEAQTASSSPQLTLEQRQQQARQWLVAFMATRFIAHHSEPTDFGEALLRDIVKWGSEWGMDDSLITLFPEASVSERAAIRGLLIALTELKLSPDEVAQQITKEVFMAELAKRDPDLAAGADIAEKAWSLVLESFRAADRGSREHGE